MRARACTRGIGVVCVDHRIVLKESHFQRKRCKGIRDGAPAHGAFKFTGLFSCM